ncbi:hypothetical protein PR048_011064 [Dryococelus australis]|uniref:Uncharacterized protein n=1 Tax=Dryococelus australis TaxID=614101 RepID=A0ABQ9HKJ8_9NEOP|nr:hypothetical protein PR048_011064 [Dryococelus australis]
MGPRGNPASKVKNRGNDTGDINTHAQCLIAPTCKACSVLAVTLYCANEILCIRIETTISLQWAVVAAADPVLRKEREVCLLRHGLVRPPPPPLTVCSTGPWPASPLRASPATTRRFCFASASTFFSSFHYLRSFWNLPSPESLRVPAYLQVFDECQTRHKEKLCAAHTRIRGEVNKERADREWKGEGRGWIERSAVWHYTTVRFAQAFEELLMTEREVNPLVILACNFTQAVELRQQQQTGFDCQRDRSRIFARGNRAGRWIWTAGFLGIFRFPPPLHSSAAPYSSRFAFIVSQDLDNLCTNFVETELRPGRRAACLPLWKRLRKPLLHSFVSCSRRAPNHLDGIGIEPAHQSEIFVQLISHLQRSKLEKTKTLNDITITICKANYGLQGIPLDLDDHEVENKSKEVVRKLQNGVSSPDNILFAIGESESPDIVDSRCCLVEPLARAIELQVRKFLYIVTSVHCSRLIRVLWTGMYIKAQLRFLICVANYVVKYDVRVVFMEPRRNARVKETGHTRVNPPASSIVRKDSHVRKSESDPRWESNRWDCNIRRFPPTILDLWNFRHTLEMKFCIKSFGTTEHKRSPSALSELCRKMHWFTWLQNGYSRRTPGASCPAYASPRREIKALSTLPGEVACARARPCTQGKHLACGHTTLTQVEIVGNLYAKNCRRCVVAPPIKVECKHRRKPLHCSAWQARDVITFITQAATPLSWKVILPFQILCVIFAIHMRANEDICAGS